MKSMIQSVEGWAKQVCIHDFLIRMNRYPICAWDFVYYVARQIDQID